MELERLSIIFQRTFVIAERIARRADVVEANGNLVLVPGLARSGERSLVVLACLLVVATIHVHGADIGHPRGDRALITEPPIDRERF